MLAQGSTYIFFSLGEIYFLFDFFFFVSVWICFTFAHPYMGLREIFMTQIKSYINFMLKKIYSYNFLGCSDDLAVPIECLNCSCCISSEYSFYSLDKSFYEVIFVLGYFGLQFCCSIPIRSGISSHICWATSGPVSRQ